MPTLPSPASSTLDALRAHKTELTVYFRELPQLLAEEEAGRYVVIHGDQTHGTWDSYRDGLQYGYERFGEAPFLVQRIDARDLGPLRQLLATLEDPAPCPS